MAAINTINNKDIFNVNDEVETPLIQLIKVNNIQMPKRKIHQLIPTRYILVGLGCAAFGLAYAYKVMLSVTLVAMVDHRAEKLDGSECPGPNRTEQPLREGEFHWDHSQQAMILGGFFYGYVIFQIPAGILAEKFGAKWLFGGFILITGLLSLLGPIAARSSFYLLFAIRFGQGFAEGVVFPCMNVLFARWLPKMERGLMGSITWTGAQIGTVVTFPLAGFLCDGEFLGGWPAVFYVLGIAACVWFVFWALLVYETPQQHPFITDEELEYITTGQGEEQTSKKPPIPWRKILTSIPVYALILTHFGQNWGYLTILTMLPTFFEKILHMDIKHNGLMSSLPYLFQSIVSLTVGFFGDRIRKSERVSVSFIRKFCNSVAFLGPALCLVAVTLTHCDTTMNIIFFTMAMALNGFHHSGYLLTHVDMAPDFAGTLMGITNSISNFTGFITPLVASAITSDKQTMARWSTVFYISSAIYVITALIYVFFATAELQSWGVARVSDKNKDNGEENPKLEF